MGRAHRARVSVGIHRGDRDAFVDDACTRLLPAGGGAAAAAPYRGQGRLEGAGHHERDEGAQEALRAGFELLLEEHKLESFWLDAYKNYSAAQVGSAHG